MLELLKVWVNHWRRGGPHFVIKRNGVPYLMRWYLIPKNRRFNIYMHKFMQDDEDRALHDHPWWFISIMLKGRYHEITEAGSIERKAPSIVFRPAEWRHRVVLRRRNDASGAIENIPCRTLIITGTPKRTWGFWCPKGFVPWQEFVDPKDEGRIGPGCDDGQHHAR